MLNNNNNHHQRPVYIRDDDDTIDSSSSSSSSVEDHSDMEDLVMATANTIKASCKVNKLRRAMLTRLARIYQNKSTSAPSPLHLSTASHKSNKQLILKVEEMLFMTATSLDEYSDFTTLTLRLKNLGKSVLSRKLRMKERSLNRRRSLHQVLGNAQMERATALVQEIQSLQLGKATTSSCTTTTNNNSNKRSLLQLSGGAKIPKPLWDLQTKARPLLAAFESQSVELSAAKWEELLTEGEAIVQNYYQWIQSGEERPVNASSQVRV